MTRLIALTFIFISIFHNAIAAEQTRQRPSANIEYFEPQPMPSSQLKREEAIELQNKDYNQYSGDHGFLWSQKHEKQTNKYITFDLNYTLPDDPDVVSNHVDYPDVGISDNALGYKGTMDLKGALGLGLTFGYQKNDSYRYEIEFTHSRMFINQFIDSFTAISKDSGNYSEEGPEMVTDYNDVLKAFSGIVNIVINFGKSKKIIPYLGAGYGYSLIGVTSEYDAYPVHQFKGGFIYKLNDTMRLYFGVKQMFYGDIKYSYKVEEANAANASYDNRTYVLEHELTTTVVAMGYKFNF